MEGSNTGLATNYKPELFQEKDREIRLLQEEKNRLEQELANLRGKLFLGDGKSSGAMNKFALWHIMAASIIALIAGAFFSS